MKNSEMTSHNDNPNFRSGFVGIIGRPNVGKSTILNYYIGSKISITSPKTQTTRQKVLGVLTLDEAQIAFLDTPGFHEPEHLLGRFMLESIKAVADDADLLVVVTDSRTAINDEDRQVFDWVKKLKKPTLLAINKVDIVKKPRLLPLIDECSDMSLFQECIPVSAKTGDQMDTLLDQILLRLPLGPQWYESNRQTDQSSERRISELVREQVLHATHQEVPHSVAVGIDEIILDQEPIIVRVTIFVERSGQKAIVIGQNGKMLKKIRIQARRGIRKALNKKVELDLWVKVKSGWRSDIKMLRELGYFSNE